MPRKSSVVLLGCVLMLAYVSSPVAASVRAEAPTGLVTPQPGGESLTVTITFPDGRSVMGLLPAKPGELIRIDHPATEEVFLFEPIRTEALTLSPGASSELQIKVTRRAAGVEMVEYRKVGESFTLKPVDASSGTLEWTVDESKHDDTRALTDRVIMLRVRELGGEWIKGGVLEGQLFRVTYPRAGRGLAVAPVMRSDGLTLHAYALEESDRGEKLFFREVLDVEAGSAIFTDTDGALYEIEVMDTGVLPEPSFDLSALPTENVDNTKCWIGCIDWTAHGCIIWSCGLHCCGTRCC